MATQTYRIKDMRVVRPSPKIAEAHPERVFTVKGKFFDEDNNPLSITSKDITVAYAKSDEFVIDVQKGLLTLPLGIRGRRPSTSLNQEDIEKALAELNS